MLSDLTHFLFGAETLTTRVVMGVLVAMSLASWSILIYRALTLRRERRHLRADARTFTEAGDLEDAFAALGARGTTAGRVTRAARAELGRLDAAGLPAGERRALVAENVGRALEQGIRTELDAQAGGLALLGSCAHAAPLLGLFGTVWGIMRAFLAVIGAEAVNLTTLAPGMSEALTTTVVGLVVAIPASLAYNALLRQHAHVETELTNLAGTVLNRIQREGAAAR